MTPPWPWAFVVPFKDSSIAKSRLHLPDGLRRQVAVAMVHDTVERLLAVPQVRRVVVVCDRPEDVAALATWHGVDVHVDHSGRGLNGAIRLGETVARGLDPLGWVAVCPGDLPWLEPGELHHVLSLAVGHARCVVPDRSGSGTTLLMAAPDVPLGPAFGEGSFAAHVDSGAEPISLPAHSSLRHDVDRMSDLRLAQRRAPRSRTARAMVRAAMSGEVAREHSR